jgi:hypothetical protein
MYIDPNTGTATGVESSNSGFINKITPQMCLIIVAVIVVIALLLIFIQSSSGGNNSSSPRETFLGNPLNATMRANPFINTPQRQML